MKRIDIPVKEIMDDYFLSCLSRETSLVGRKEVFTGKAKFGIFGDGKEIPQVAMARVFRNSPSPLAPWSMILTGPGKAGNEKTINAVMRIVNLCMF